MNIETDDDDLLVYAELHCKTPRALFHVAHISRILVLAGQPPLEETDGFFAVHEEEMKPLLEKARAKLHPPPPKVPVPKTPMPVVEDRLESWAKKFLHDTGSQKLSDDTARALLDYVLRQLSHKRIPNVMLVTSILDGTTKVPKCGWIGCFIDYEHVH
jgi:hypothetical protein